MKVFKGAIPDKPWEDKAVVAKNRDTAVNLFSDWIADEFGEPEPNWHIEEPDDKTLRQLEFGDGVITKNTLKRKKTYPEGNNKKLQVQRKKLTRNKITTSQHQTGARENNSFGGWIPSFRKTTKLRGEMNNKKPPSTKFEEKWPRRSSVDG